MCLILLWFLVVSSALLWMLLAFLPVSSCGFDPLICSTVPCWTCQEQDRLISGYTCVFLSWKISNICASTRCTMYCPIWSRLSQILDFLLVSPQSAGKPAGVWCWSWLWEFHWRSMWNAVSESWIVRSGKLYRAGWSLDCSEHRCTEPKRQWPINVPSFSGQTCATVLLVTAGQL